MLTVASAPPGITLERKPPSTIVFVNVVRSSELISGPNGLRRDDAPADPLDPAAAAGAGEAAEIGGLAAARSSSPARGSSAASGGDSCGALRWRLIRVSARASRSIALGGCGRAEWLETPRVCSTTDTEILSRTVTAASCGPARRRRC